MALPGNYTRTVPITPSDSVNYKPVGDQSYADAIWVGGAGIVQLVAPDGAVVPHTCVAGTLLPVRSIRVNAGSTTATLMNALYYV